MKTRHAFTLVELLTVIVIIGILVTIITVAVAAAFRAIHRGKIGMEMGQIAIALDRYKAEFGEYPPDMLDDEALVRHVKKRWPRLNWENLEKLPFANDNQYQGGYNPLLLTGLEREAWLIRNAVSVAYGQGEYLGRFYHIDFNDWYYKGFSMNLDEVPYSRPGGALALWLGGFPNADGKLSGFYADPENPFTPSDTFDGKVFLDLEMGNNKRVRGIMYEVWDSTPSGEVIGSVALYTYAVPVLGIEIRGTFLPFTYFRGRADGGDGAYRIGGEGGPIKNVLGPYARNPDNWGGPYAESVSTVHPESGEPGTPDVRVIRWYNPTTYQLIHPGLDGKLGDDGGVPIRVISTGEGISAADLDNITNFSDNKPLRSILP